MTAVAEIAGTVRPRLLRGVRLRQDMVRGGHVLLAPERIVRTNPVAVAVLQRCDGVRSLEEIVNELCAVYNGEFERVGRDVRTLLADLVAKRMVAL